MSLENKLQAGKSFATVLVFIQVYKVCWSFSYWGDASRCGYIAKAQERWVWGEARMRGFPTAMTQRKRWRGAVNWGHPEWVEPCDMDPDEKESWGQWNQG